MALRVVAHHVVVLGNPDLIIVHYNLAAVELAKPSRAFFVKVVACKVLRIAVVQCLAQQRCTCWCKSQHCSGKTGLTIQASRRAWLRCVGFQLSAQIFEHNNVMLACCCHTDDIFVGLGLGMCFFVLQTKLGDPVIVVVIVVTVHAGRSIRCHNSILIFARLCT